MSWFFENCTNLERGAQPLCSFFFCDPRAWATWMASRISSLGEVQLSELFRVRCCLELSIPFFPCSVSSGLALLELGCFHRVWLLSFKANVGAPVSRFFAHKLLKHPIQLLCRPGFDDSISIHDDATVGYPELLCLQTSGVLDIIPDMIRIFP